MVMEVQSGSRSTVSFLYFGCLPCNMMAHIDNKCVVEGWVNIAGSLLGVPKASAALLSGEVLCDVLF